MTEVPFPLPALRTGRAVFPHPALGQGSTEVKRGTVALRGSPPSDLERLNGRFLGLHHSPCPFPRRAASLNSGPFPPPAFTGFLGVGSEEARRSAGLRPPLKLDVRFSRIQLSQRRVNNAGSMKESGGSGARVPTRRTVDALEAVSSPGSASA